MLQEISEKQGLTLAEVKEASAESKEAKKKAEDLTAKVEQLNQDFAEIKGANIKDLIEEVKNLKAKQGSPIKGVAEHKQLWTGDLIVSAIREHKENLWTEAGKEVNGKKGIELKAVTSGSLSGDPYLSYLDWQPGMEPTGQTRFRQLVRTIGSETDFVRFPRANTPIGSGSFGRQANEGDTKAEVGRGYTMIELTLKPMAGWIELSRQSLRNITFLQSWLPTSLLEQLNDSEDSDFANSLVAAATGNSTTTGTKVIDRLVHYIRNLRKAKFNPNGITVDPDIWSNLILNTETNAGFNLPRVVTVTEDGTVRVLGRPVFEVNWLTGGRVIVGDWSKTAIIQSEGLMMRQSDSHASNFTSNEVVMLLERTEGLAVFRPDAFVTAVLS